jgi:HSP20 family protein
MKDDTSSSTKESTDAPVTIDEFCSTPPADIYETSREIVILVDLPGVESQDMDLELDGSNLNVIGKVAAMQKEGRNLLLEYCRCNYFRSFYVADMVDRSSITAEFAEGVLKIVLPKAEQAISRSIPISSDPSYDSVQ